MPENTYEFLCNLPRADFYKNGLNYRSGLYYSTEHPRQYMECFYKEGCTNMPVILWIHGGAWDDEYLTASYRPELTLAQLAANGYFIACLEYRLSRHAPLPACLEDCEKAIQFLRDHADELLIDPEKIGLWGESAGAHIACMVGSNYSGKMIKPVQCIISFYCPSDLCRMARDMGQDIGFLVNVLPHHVSDQMEQERIFQKMSPISYADRSGIPPVLLFHGEQDSVVSCEQSVIYAEKLRNAGNEAEMILVPGQGHGFFEGRKYYDRIIQFIEKKIPKNGGKV